MDLCFPQFLAQCRQMTNWLARRVAAEIGEWEASGSGFQQTLSHCRFLLLFRLLLVLVLAWVTLAWLSCRLPVAET